MDMESMHIGDYCLIFEAEGACIEHRSRKTRYRVPGEQASSAVAFTRHHWQLCVAMMRDRHVALEPFRMGPRA